MPPRIVVDTNSPTPPYEQVRGQLADIIELGVLTAGERLPPVRQLAADLGLATGTVARAYRELEQSGHVVSRRGGGTRVAPRTTDARDHIALLSEYAASYLAKARGLGFEDHEIHEAVNRATANR
jgi:DNA-binding transcriptional regulator YhcF (GntR family)